MSKICPLCKNKHFGGSMICNMCYLKRRRKLADKNRVVGIMPMKGWGHKAGWAPDYDRVTEVE